MRKLLDRIAWKLGYINRHDTIKYFDHCVNRDSEYDIMCQAYESMDWSLIMHAIRRIKMMRQVIVDMERVLFYGAINKGENV